MLKGMVKTPTLETLLGSLPLSRVYTGVGNTSSECVVNNKYRCQHVFPPLDVCKDEWKWETLPKFWTTIFHFEDEKYSPLFSWGLSRHILPSLHCQFVSFELMMQLSDSCTILMDIKNSTVLNFSRDEVFSVLN